MEALMNLYTVTEASADIGCSTGYVRHLLIAGVLKGQKLNTGMWLVDKASVKKFKKVEVTTGRPRSKQKQKSA